MQLTIELPDDVARALESLNGSSLSRSLVEMIALEGYRSGSLTHAQVRRLLGLENRIEVDVFLKQHGVPLPYSVDDLEEDLETHRRLGL